MSDQPAGLPVYEIPGDALKPPWVSRSFVALVNTLGNAPKQRISVAVVPALLSIAFHTLLIGSVIWSGAQARATYRAEHTGPGSSGIVSADEPVMTLILINEPSPVRSEPTEISLASRGFAPLDRPVTLISPDPTPAFDSSEPSKGSESRSAAEADDTASRGILFGRYVGQIRARIERAWMRPRTAIGAASFYCVVQITQDLRGNVKETALQSCNGDGRWQLSLVRAIQSASPLPAPPDPKVFADAVTMKFEAQAFGSASNAQDYEPQPALAVAAAQQSNAPLRQFEDQLHSSRKSGSESIELIITGAPEGIHSATVPH